MLNCDLIFSVPTDQHCPGWGRGTAYPITSISAVMSKIPWEGPDSQLYLSNIVDFEQLGHKRHIPRNVLPVLKLPFPYSYFKLRMKNVG